MTNRAELMAQLRETYRRQRAKLRVELDPCETDGPATAGANGASTTAQTIAGLKRESANLDRAIADR